MRRHETGGRLNTGARVALAATAAVMASLAVAHPSHAAEADPVVLRLVFTDERVVLEDAGDLLGPRAAGPDLVEFGLAAQIPEPSTRLWLELFWNGGDATVGLESATGAAGFGDLVRDAGFDVRVIEGDGSRRLEEGSLPIDLDSDIGIQVVEVTAPRDRVEHRDPPRMVVFGVGESVPGLIAIVIRKLESGEIADEPALLDPVRSGLPGVVSPYDLTRTLAEMLRIEVDDDAPGALLRWVPDPDAASKVGALRDRFVRDLEWRAPLSQAAVAIIIPVCLIGLIAAMRRGSMRIVRSSGGLIMGAFAGSLAAALLPLGAAPLRFVMLALGCVIGAAMPTARTYIAASWKMLAALSILTVVAAARGVGEPALSLWPSPLEASRASGLLNGYCVLIVGSLLTLTALGWGSRWARGLLAAAAIGIIGAPQLGANYGGVVFAVVAIAGAAAIERVGKLRVRDLVTVGALGLVVLIGALALDIGGQTHGGRLLDTFREDGIGVIVDVLRGRWETSAVVTGRFGMIAWIGFWLMLPILAVILVGVVSPTKVRLFERLSLRVRAGVGGLVLAAITALILEDTGFLTAGGLLGFIVALILFDVAPPPPQHGRVPAKIPAGAPA